MVYRILFRLLTTLIFSPKSFPDFIEYLDDQLTDKYPQEHAQKLTASLNRLLLMKPVAWLLERQLNKNVPLDERIDLDPERVKERHERLLPTSPNRQRWHNWMETAVAEPLKYVFPGTSPYKDLVKHKEKLKTDDYSTLQEIRAIIAEAEANNFKVRAVASGHALSDIAATTDFLVNTRRITQIQRPANHDWIKLELRNGFPTTIRIGETDHEEQHYLYETGAGTSVKDLNELLTSFGWGLLNAGGSDIQGLFGAVSTSTHGSGINIGPYPNFVRSMVLVSAGGKAYRIEPTEGISIREEYEKTEEVTKHGVQLVQDDEWFRAALVSMGCFGIAYSAIIEVREKYELYEERRLGVWEVEKERFQEMGRKYPEQHRHFELALNPYPLNENGDIDPNGTHECMVTTRNYVNAQTPPAIGITDRRNFLSSVLTGISFAGSISTWLFNKNPERIPKNISNSLKRIVDVKEDGGGYRDWSYNVLNQGLQEMKFHGYAIEIGFPVDRVVEAVDAILDIALQSARDYKQYHPAPFACRFVDTSPAYLSMMSDRPSVMIEVVALKGVIGGSDLLNRIEKAMMKIDGRPHWGLNMDNFKTHGGEFEELYPGYPKWRKVYKDLGAADTFGNAFSKRMGFDQ